MADQPDAALEPILTKLAAARTRLIMERPFLGALVMHLPLKVGGERYRRAGLLFQSEVHRQPQSCADAVRAGA